jgi:hypothetical protein
MNAPSGFSCETCPQLRSTQMQLQRLTQENQALRDSLARRQDDWAQRLKQALDQHQAQLEKLQARHKDEVARKDAQLAKLKVTLAVYKDSPSGKNRPDRFSGEMPLGPKRLAGEDVDCAKASASKLSEVREAVALQGPTPEASQETPQQVSTEAKPRKRKGHDKGGRKMEEYLLQGKTIVLRPEIPSCSCCRLPMDWQRDLPSRSRPRIQAVMEAVVETVCSVFAVYRCPGCQKEVVVQAKAPDNRKYSLLTRVQTVTDHIRHQIPRSRLAERFRDLKLAHISDSLIWNWIKEVAADTIELYKAIVCKTQASQLMQIDASGLPIHSVEENDHRRDELTSKHWPLWQVQTLCTVVFFLTSRQYTENLLVFFSARIAQAKAAGEKIYLLADRAKNIAALGKLGIEIAFCWVHLRRDFITLGNQHPGHLEFARSWTKLLRTTFRLYHKRRKQIEDSPTWHHFDAELRTQIDKIKETAAEQMGDPKTPELRKKVLASLQKHWHGLILFLDHPFIPIHNNEVERRFRWLAIFRRISFGCVNEKSALIRAQLYTIYHTLDINKIPATDYLVAFLQEKYACKQANHDMKLEEWLPWSLSPRVRDLVFKKH